MSYSRFASVYDALMNDAPYDEWEAYVKQESAGGSLLDIGCGTGELAVRFARAGYRVTGIDLSDEMLAVARDKADQHQVSMPLFQQDMREMEGLGLFDIAAIFCDSLNYLETEEDVERTFRSVFAHLKEGGLFLFDVHSVFKVNEVFTSQTFADAGEDVSFIWNAFPGEEADSVEHELTFFVQAENGTYERFDELHRQRTFQPEQYKDWLIKAGFTVESITADFTASEPTEQSERIFFKAKKNSC
ncbi:class I SAM-dependent DNA methyltransferase [Domibacillus enclensis]|uniref:Methyltransferase domain-containing protein n=1 Tax=Domibacillus enclensis TaxID=1017273 RepID=A0A1N6PSV0_9BACI|nr:class I SAM-dependent methyltransferase [Domibacillus enclensis]OXS80468.1 SAM-dependent methyltransferase [Domibacillus enclensis]SIQ07289.1 Methyltransferase domain-containing protein [Domibacillus enclensis]